MLISFKSLHWGTDENYVEELWVPSNEPGSAVVPLRAISYVTVKDGKPEVFRHEFSKVAGRYPQLIDLQTRGDLRSPLATKSLVCLGHVIDLEPTQGSRILVSGVWVCTTQGDVPAEGGPVLLASRIKPLYAIERRSGKPGIRNEGIVD